MKNTQKIVSLPLSLVLLTIMFPLNAGAISFTFNQGSGIVCKLGDTPNADHVVGSAPPLTQLLIFDRGLATANIEVHVDTTNTQAWKVVTELWDTAWTTFEAVSVKVQ